MNRTFIPLFDTSRAHTSRTFFHARPLFGLQRSRANLTGRKAVRSMYAYYCFFM
jgi:hypothetical protein